MAGFGGNGLGNLACFAHDGFSGCDKSGGMGDASASVILRFTIASWSVRRFSRSVQRGLFVA